MRVIVLVVVCVFIISSIDCAETSQKSEEQERESKRTGRYPFQKGNTGSGDPEAKRTGMFHIAGDSNPGSNNPILGGR